MLFLAAYGNFQGIGSSWGSTFPSKREARSLQWM